MLSGKTVGVRAMSPNIQSLMQEIEFGRGAQSRLVALLAGRGLVFCVFPGVLSALPSLLEPQAGLASWQLPG